MNDEFEAYIRNNPREIFGMLNSRDLERIESLISSGMTPEKAAMYLAQLTNTDFSVMSCAGDQSSENKLFENVRQELLSLLCDQAEFEKILESLLGSNQFYQGVACTAMISAVATKCGVPTDWVSPIIVAILLKIGNTGRNVFCNTYWNDNCGT